MKKLIICLLFVWPSVWFLAQEQEKSAEVEAEKVGFDGFQQAFLKGQYDKALTATEEHRLKAMCLWRLGRVKQLKELIKTSADPFVSGDKIRLAVLSKGPVQAVIEGKEWLKNHPDDFSAYTETIFAAIESGDVPSLKELVKQKVDFKAFDALAFERMILAKISLGYMLGDPSITRDAVVNLCEEGLIRFPWNPRFNLLRCLYYYRIGQRVDAGDFAKELAEQSALDPMMIKLPGDEKAAGGLIPQDTNQFENNFFVLHTDIKNQLLGRESFSGIVGRKNAKPQIEKLEDLAPKHPQTLIFRGALDYLENSEPKEPADLKKVTVKNGGYWFMVAELVSEAFDRRPALPFGRRALNVEEWQVDWMVFHAFNCHREGYEKEALKYLKKAHKLEPRMPEVYNLKRLLESMEATYVEERNAHFRVFMRRDEHKAFKFVLMPQLEAEYQDLAKRYQIKPKEFNVKLFSDKQDFDVSVFAVPSAPAIGACMGRLVTLPAPSYLEYKLEPWAAVLRHELAHAFHIERSKGRVTRWFTEGLAHYEETVSNKTWDWEEGYDQKLVNMKAEGKLAKFGELDPAFNGEDVRFYYQYCSWIMRWIDEEKGWDKIIKILDAYSNGISDSKIFDEVLDLSNEEAEKEFWTWLDENIYSKIPYPALIEGALDSEEGLAFAYSKGNYLEILKATKDSQKAIPLFYRALVIEELEGGEAAEVVFAKAKDGLKDHFMFNYRYGRNLYEAGEYKKAEKHLLKAIEIYPNRVADSDNPYYWLYQVYKETKEKDKSIEVIWKFTRIQQKDHRGRFWLARRYKEKNNFKRFNQLLKEIREIYPYHFESILWEADQAKRENNKQKEKQCYQRLFACAVLEDLVDQEILWSDQERLDFLKKAITPWLSITEGEEKMKAALTMEKFFPNHPEVKNVIKVLTK